MRWIAIGLAALLGGCASGSAQDTQDITVFAASSLKDPFTELAQQYERQNPGTQITVNLAGSADLVAQLQQGAQTDALATADETTMTAAGQVLALAPKAFATNALVIAVPAGNPAGVRSLQDLADPALNVVICAPQVPCGAATQRVETASGVTIAADSEESAVTDVLGKVTSGQADAGVVYVSDALGAAQDVEAIAIPAAVNTTTTYMIAAVNDRAAGFVDLVLSDTGRRTLADSGFGPP